MKLLLTHGTRDIAARIDPDGTHYRVTLDAAEYRIDGTVGATTRVRIDGRPVEARIRRQGENVLVEIRGRAFSFRVRDPRAMRLARRRSGADLALGELHAPMPGLVVEVLAEEGDSVESGRPIIIVEAMKMQNALLAPVSGRVRSVPVAPGTAVETGQLLLAITPEEI